MKSRFDFYLEEDWKKYEFEEKIESNKSIPKNLKDLILEYGKICYNSGYANANFDISEGDDF